VTPERQALVTYRLERAHETIEEAELLVEKGHANAGVNRLYYACFYAVSALLLTRNVSSSKHSYVRSLLHRDYIKPGHVSKEMGDHYDLLFDSRQKGDYADFVIFDVRDVRPWLEPTRSFVDSIAGIIDREIQKDTPCAPSQEPL
jgi:uncharacterized protein (UPF0332 family)